MPLGMPEMRHLADALTPTQLHTLLKRPYAKERMMEDPLEENPTDTRNRRILRRGDSPQNPEDAAALKLLSVFERLPQLDILRLTVYTPDPKGSERHRPPTEATLGIMLLELRSADYAIGRSSSLLYLRVEVTLEEVLRMPVGELVAWLCEELAAREALVSALALKGGPPRAEVVLAN
jgi:hypothetical protein